MSVINITGDQTPKLDRIAEYWPCTIQQYWRGLETRHQSLQGKLVSESIRLRGASRPTVRCLPSVEVSFRRPIP